jgi:hypothetical protein
MFVKRTVLVLVCAMAPALPVFAQASGPIPAASDSLPSLSTRGYLGLLPGRTRSGLSCGLPGFSCDRPTPQLYAGYVIGRNISVYGYTDTAIMGGPSEYGAGLSWNFSPSLQATLGWDSREQRFGSERSMVRSANVGMQWRY